MKILISAYACETGRGSEGEIGWRLVHQLAQSHDVWVITRANLRVVHAAAFSAAPKPQRLNFIYFDLPWAFRFYKRGNRFFLFYYYLWQIGAGLHARRISLHEKFDILHHLVGGMDWMPAGLALAPGKLVWGPVGSEDTHPLIRRTLSRWMRFKDRLRLAVRWGMRTFDPLVRFSAARSSVILSHTPETMPYRYFDKMQSFAQTGIENNPSLARPKADLARCARLRLVFAGELKEWKGARLALQAALKFFENEPMADLIIIGDGPLRASMEADARSHLHGARVHFAGKVPMAALVNTLNSGDVFLYPSFHHGMATVVLQAMLTGLPIVCIEGDAIGRTVAQEAGITVPLIAGHDPATDLAAALSALAADEPRRQALAYAARNIAIERFSYDRQAQSLLAVYRDIAESKHENK